MLKLLVRGPRMENPWLEEGEFSAFVSLSRVGRCRVNSDLLHSGIREPKWQCLLRTSSVCALPVTLVTATTAPGKRGKDGGGVGCCWSPEVRHIVTCAHDSLERI